MPESESPIFIQRIKVILALHQQTEVAFEVVAICDTFGKAGKLGVDTLVDAEAFEVSPDERQAGVGDSS